MEPHHTREIFQRRGGNWQMRKAYPKAVFGDVIKDPAFLETYTRWMAGECDLSTLAARIDVSCDNPFAFVIVDHRHKLVGGMDWRERPLRDYDGPWQMHMDELAGEYWEAKIDGIQCWTIQQEFEGVRRDYERLIVPRGKELLVFSSTFTGTMQ